MSRPAASSPSRWPRTVGQVPMVYAHTRSHEPENQARRYWDEASTPLFPFGYGLSYGRFEYANLTVDQPAISHEWDGHRVGGGHQHGGSRSRRGRPALHSPAPRLGVASGARAQGLLAGHARGRGITHAPVPGRAERAAVLERGGPRLGDRCLDLRRLGRRRLDGTAVDERSRSPRGKRVPRRASPRSPHRSEPSVRQAGVPVGAATLRGGVEQEPQRVHLDRASRILAGVGHVTGDLVAPEVTDHAVSTGEHVVGGHVGVLRRHVVPRVVAARCRCTPAGRSSPATPWRR